MDIAVWLRSMGLGKYEAAFRENDGADGVRALRPQTTRRKLPADHHAA
jgi:hypothetical protein